MSPLCQFEMTLTVDLPGILGTVNHAITIIAS